jgi:hypothetical protein
VNSTAYKQRAASAATTSWDPTALLVRGAEAYVAPEYAYIAQRAKIERIATENDAVRHIHNEVVDAILMLLFKSRFMAEPTE